MQLIFANPSAVWALLGVPAVLAIHLIQERLRERRVSTLFLIEKHELESVRGGNIDWIRNSKSLWLQLLCVCLLTWSLSEPRWIRSDSVQRIIILLDSSASMQAIAERLNNKLSDLLEHINNSAAKTEWVLLETNLSHELIYKGLSLAVLKEKISTFQPSLGMHNFSYAFDYAFKIRGESGAVFFISDQSVQVPSWIEPVALGEPIDNVGFVGYRINNNQFEVIVKNFSKIAQVRSWSIESGGVSEVGQDITLPAGGMQLINGKFPEDQQKIKLLLNHDRFILDDEMPLIRTKAKTLKVHIAAQKGSRTYWNKLINSIGELQTTRDEASSSLQIVEFDGSVVSDSKKPSIGFFASSQSGLSVGDIPLSESSWVQDLEWSGFIAQARSFALGRNDRVLVWQGARPLILERNKDNLLLNFDISTSNAFRHPSFIILLQRFINRIRQHRIDYEQRNINFAEGLNLNTGGDERIKVKMHNARSDSEEFFGPMNFLSLQLPVYPGFVEVEKGSEPLLSAAVQFFDSFESDFSNAKTEINYKETLQQLRLRSSEEDIFAEIALVLLIAGMGLSFLVAQGQSFWRAQSGI